MTSKERYTELIEKQRKLKEELGEIGEEAVKESFQDIFTKFPKVKEISWKQYAYYFNDGDPCYFSVRSWTAEINGYGVEDGTPDLEDLGMTEEEFNEVSKFVTDTIDLFDEDLMEQLFGDDSIVTVTRKGITSEGYGDHD